MLIVRTHPQGTLMCMYNTHPIQITDYFKHAIMMHTLVPIVVTSYKASNNTWCQKLKGESSKENTVKN